MATILLAAWAAVSLALIVVGGFMVTSDEKVADTDTGPKVKKKGELFVLTAVADLIGTPFARPMLRLLAPWRSKLARRIDAAGRPAGLTVEVYARQSAGYVIIFGTLGTLLIMSGKLIIGIPVVLFAGYNEGLLFFRTRKRQDEIQRTMPDFLDVLAVTVAAGLNFRQAVARVAESMPGVLAEEFTVALRQMDLGSPRRTAFEDLRERNRAEALRQFVTAILQAEELGAPLSGALLDIAEDMRRDAAQFAKRKAQRTTPMVIGVTALLSLPSFVALVVGAMYFGLKGDGPGGFFG